MTQIPLSWKLSMEGTDDVLNKLRRVHSEFQKGEIDTAQYAKSLREVKRDLNTFAQTSAFSTKIFLAQNPVIGTLSRSFSTLASVSRTMLSITNALNIARIASNTADSRTLEVQRQISETMRAINRESDPEKLQSLNEQLAVLKAELKELGDQKITDGLTHITILFSTIAGGGLATLKLIQGLAPALSTLGAVSLGATPLLALAGAVTSIALAAGVWLAVWEKLNNINGPFSSGLEALSGILGPITKAIIGFFTLDIPNAVKAVGESLTQFFLTDLPTWAMNGFNMVKTAFVTVWNGIVKTLEGGINSFMGGFESFLNGIINGINRIISGLNKLPFVSIAKISPVSLPRVSIPLIPAKDGFEGMVNSPTMFLAGESGAEHVSITPNGGSRSSSGTTINQYITVQGSLVSERELFRIIGKHQKTKYKRLGFTGV